MKGPGARTFNNLNRNNSLKSESAALLIKTRKLSRVSRDHMTYLDHVCERGKGNLFPGKQVEAAQEGEGEGAGQGLEPALPLLQPVGEQHHAAHQKDQPDRQHCKANTTFQIGFT